MKGQYRYLNFITNAFFCKDNQSNGPENFSYTVLSFLLQSDTGSQIPHGMSHTAAGTEHHMDQTVNQSYFGKLIVQTTSAKNAIPVVGATVVVRKLNDDGTSQVLTVMNTDINGQTPPFEIETPSPSESLSPGNAKPYTDISIEISADGYYGLVNTHVPIYPGVTSLQPAWLIPVSESETRYPSGSIVINEEIKKPSL